MICNAVDKDFKEVGLNSGGGVWRGCIPEAFLACKN